MTHSYLTSNPNNPNRRPHKRNKTSSTTTQAHAAAINDINVDQSKSFLHTFVSVTDDACSSTHHLDVFSSPLHFETTTLPNENGSIPLDERLTQEVDECFALGENVTVTPHYDLKSLRLRSTSVMTVGSIQNTPNKKPLRVLFDTGADVTMANYRILPKGANPKTVPATNITGVHDSNQHNQQILIEDVGLPEFSPSQRIPGPIRATMFRNDKCQYDLIIGMDLLQVLGIQIDCATKTVTWQDMRIPFRPSNYFDIASFTLEADDDLSTVEAAAKAGYKSSTILHSKYDQVSPHVVAQQQKHLSVRQQEQLANVLKKFDKLFNGKLDKFPGREVHLDLLPDAKPFSCRPYPVPKKHEQVFKDELQRLCDCGVLSRCGASEWLAPTFVIPKKDGRVRWITDFRQLNRMIRRKVYNLPKIQDILNRRSGYTFFSKIDVSMHYYTFELDEESKNLCAICTPFGNYRYNRLPMGVSQSPDIAQEVMEDLFRDLDQTDVYIDDVGVFDDSWEQHLQSLDKVLQILQKHNFTVNPLKCEWGVKETDWLGYWLTPVGLKPWRKKIDAILAIQRPKTSTQLRSFLGAVNFYRDMYPKRSHILAPLTKLSGTKGTIPWSPECQSAFDQMKALLAKEAFLAYPDHNKPFHIYVDASDLQLGAAIFQDNKPVAYYSRKLNAAQRNYTVGEKELLSIVETLKEFRTTLYGCQNIHVYTDHKNNTFANLQTQRVLRWRLFLEDYGVQLHYIKGETNHIADALSRLPFDERQTTPDTPQADDSKVTSKFEQLQNYHSMAIDEPNLLDCFVNLPASEGIPFVLDYNTIREAQDVDARLQADREAKPQCYPRHLLAPGLQLLCYIGRPNDEWKIYLPSSLLDDAIKWYHLALGHIGRNRLYDTIKQHFYHPDLRNRIDHLVERCPECQKQKNPGRGYGEQAPRDATIHPWREVAVDLIGPWKLTINNVEVSFSALTIIDQVSNLVELVRIDNKTSEHIALQFENTWLSRYPWPKKCIHDQGGEFTGFAFQRMLDNHNIRSKPTTAKNPQGNSLCERMHQTVGNTLRAMINMNPPDGIQQAQDLVDTALANCMFATRATIHSALQATPGSLSFSRDMILDIPVQADWLTIQQKRQTIIDNRLIKANRLRHSYDYQVGDQVLKLVYNPDKLQPRAVGPYRIETVHANGTVTIRKTPVSIERINIRRIKPFKN